MRRRLLQSFQAFGDWRGFGEAVIWATFSRYIAVVAAAVAAFVLMSSAQATPVTFTASGVSAQPTAISASATFSVSGSDLVIALTNTSTTNTGYHNPDLLEGLFFNVSGNPTLTPVSAVLTAGSSIVNGPIPAGQTLGDQWQYQFHSGGYTNPTIAGQNGISAAGFSNLVPSFSSGNFGSNSQNVDGLGFGIVGTDYNSATASGLAKTATFEKDSVTFTLSGLPGGFDPFTEISGVTFAYGTAPDSTLSGQRVPEPGTLILLSTGLLLLASTMVSRLRQQA